MFKNFTYIMSNKLFYIFAVVVVTLSIIVTIACCVEFYGSPVKVSGLGIDLH